MSRMTGFAKHGWLQAAHLRGLLVCACCFFVLPVIVRAQDSPGQNAPLAAQPASPAKNDPPPTDTTPDDYKPSLLKKQNPAPPAPAPSAPSGNGSQGGAGSQNAPVRAPQGDPSAPKATNSSSSAAQPPTAPSPPVTSSPDAAGNPPTPGNASAPHTPKSEDGKATDVSGSAAPAQPESPSAAASPAPAPAASASAPAADSTAANTAASGTGGSLPEMTTRTSQVPLESHVNLVPVRVVVHDSKGNAVADLREEDFQIRQDGRVQVISHFSVETPASLAAQVVRGTAADKLLDATSYSMTPPTSDANPPTPAGGSLALPSRFVALVVDDAHLEIGDLIRLRIAAMRYVNQSVKPNERVALFTVSGQSQVDFTDDKAKIESQLKVLIPRAVGASDPATSLDCLKITYYQADLIENKNDPQALQAAIADAQACGATSESQAAATAASTALEVLQAGNVNTEYSIRRLDEIVRRISAMPGQRTMVLISSGFLTSTYEYDVSQVIDRATRQNVFINTLDARGLYTVDPLGDITQPVPVRANVATSALSLQYREAEQQAQSDVLSNLAASTGGFYFRNNNSLDAGLLETASEPAVSYLLAFVPSGLKNDGKFHSISVKLMTKDHYAIQARRGFFAPKHGKTPEQMVKQDIEDAVFSQEEQRGLPVQLHLQYFKVDEGNAKLSVLTHVDITQVKFDHNDGRNWDDLTVVAALFDRNGNFIGAKEETLEMRLKDATLEKLNKSGVTLKSDFDVKPGGYLVRLVVRDAKAAQMAARNGVVEIP
jgi:VWFA-related protein